MSSYIIAGSSDKVDTSECENMANLIRQYYPDISFKIVLKDLTQWEQYVDEICRIYGFKQKSNPIIYTMDGSLIGDRNAFIALAENRFGFVDQKLRQGPITPDVNKKIAKQDLDAKLKLQKGKKTLIEKIESKMLIIYANNVVTPTDGVFKQSFKTTVKDKLKTWYDSLNNLIRSDVKRNLSSESVYSQSFRNGMKFLYKFEDRLRPIKKLEETHQLTEEKQKIDESNYVEIEEKDENKQLVVKQVLWFSETQRFLTLEQEKLQLLLLEQAQQREREQSHKSSMISPDQRTNTAELNDSGASPKAALQAQPIVEAQNEEQEQDTIKQDIQEGQPIIDQQNELDPNNTNNLGENIEQDPVQSIGEAILERNEDVEMVEGDQSHNADQIEISELIIHKFRNDYALILHPFPLMDGQMLLCKPINNHILDYSCLIRGRINSYKKSSAASSNCEGLLEPQLDIFKCITIQDCEMITKIINKCDALVVLNILPQDLESFLPLSNGHYSVILRSHAELNKSNKKLFKYLNEQKESINFKQLMPLEEFILDQRSQCFEIYGEIYKIKSLDIDHYFAFPPQILTADNLNESIIRIISIILDNDHSAAIKMGFNLVISKNIIFFCPTFTNYDTIDGFKLHLQAFTSLGFLNLPTGSKQINFFELLKKTQVK